MFRHDSLSNHCGPTCFRQHVQRPQKWGPPQCHCDGSGKLLQRLNPQRTEFRGSQIIVSISSPRQDGSSTGSWATVERVSQRDVVLVIFLRLESYCTYIKNEREIRQEAIM